ncbi:unnamed protein product [Bursaphelenchus xylophilus]|uniref:phospholipase A2 n=1 Tax=Bursaphelenchus xylophilus TaxID=6326 RepID=A0A1I7SM49_BURXY|nr:unnamed protein product [Bursaphelenchus xylophilus]CAG9129997.1 unnamed protein product [Bursaphelenchus xylophilus]
MDFFKNAVKTAQEMKKSVMEVSKEIQVAKQRGRSKSPDGKVQKVSMNTMEGLEDRVSGFGVYKEMKTNMFHIILVDSQESVYRTSSQEEAKAVMQQLNQHSTLIKAAVISGRLEDFCNQIRAHNDWADIHLASYLNFEDYVINECKKRDPVVVLNRATALDGRFPLHLAAERRHVALVVKMLKLGADMRKSDISGRNALHYAAMHDSALIRALKKHSADHFAAALQQRDKRGYTPLHCALQTNHQDTIEFLIDSGAKVTADHGLVAGLSALGLDSILARDPAVVSPDNTSNIFHQKIEKKYLKVANKRNPRMLSQKNERGRTPAHNAVLRDDLDGLVNLVAYGADVAESDEDGNTPLHLATLQQTPVIIKFLIAMDGGTQERNKEDKTPSDLCGTVECAKIFQLYNQSLALSDKGSGKELPPIIKTAQQASILYQTKPDSRENGLRLLSLDGGGIRGIALVMILIHIDKQIANGNIIDYIDWVAGTSTGAILSLALAAGTSLRDCLNLYLRLKDDVFSGPRPHDVGPLEACLKEKFDAKTMADLNQKIKVMVTTTKADVHPPELILFRNYELPETQVKSFKPKDVHVWKAARCSSAAPTYFASFDNTYLDGGLMANNPSLDLLNEVHIYNISKQLNEQDPDPISLLLSLGTGKCKSKPMSAIDLELPKSFSWTSVVSTAFSSMNTLKNLKNIFVEQLAASDGQVVERSRGWCHSLRTPFFRFTPTLHTEIPLNTCSNTEIVDLMWQTKLYCISRSDQEIEEVVRLLRANDK